MARNIPAALTEMPTTMSLARSASTAKRPRKPKSITVSMGRMTALTR